jgi:dipeptidyl aminopeptidase/acylaminoacyl peptidase
MFSPVNHIDKTDPPVLIYHGKKDTTVDYLQAMQLAEEFDRHNVGNKLQLLKNAEHSFDIYSSGYNIKLELLTFFDLFLQEEGDDNYDR